MTQQVVPTKQCRSIISTSYTSWFLAAYNEKSVVCKVIQGGILKSALLCRDYPGFNFFKRFHKTETRIKIKSLIEERYTWPVCAVP
jgi:hypothetical protein